MEARKGYTQVSKFCFPERISRIKCVFMVWVITQRRESRARLGLRGYEKIERSHSDLQDEGSCLPEAFTSARSAPGRLPAGRQGRLGPSQGQRWSQKPGRALWGGQDSWSHLVCWEPGPTWELQGQDSWASVRPGL